MNFENLLILAAAEAAKPNPYNTYILMGAFFVVMYLMLIRPQQRREKERKAMMEAIKKGDQVVTSGGIVGVVSNIKKDDRVLITTGDTRVEITRASIAGLLTDDDGSSDDKK
jgi:preprotein translocase subunit YajC